VNTPTLLLAALPLKAEDPEGFHAPGPEIFDLPPLWEGAPTWLTKPTLLAMLSAVILIAVFWGAFANPKLVPRGLQNIGEIGYTFVRDQIGRPFLGKDTDRFMPLLFSIFFMVLVWNLMGVFPVIQFPVASHIAFPIVLAAAVYLLRIYLGIKHQGPIGYFKNMMFPPGVPKPVYVLLAPIEFLSNLILAPATHALRLFANMFAGHMLLAFFSMVGFYFIFQNFSVLGLPVGVLGTLVTIAMTGLEMFIQFLQAYLFAMLAAMYIGNSLHAEH
jgi:F-type H+-transporting ATPase subunit a